ncbi:hypothetical protein AB0B71_04825 [Micromonospora echinofusca]|uniref:hypothetical protein n=1 Tax=Micromonospora echinofusca TaxID=47858 RepID=UPI0033D4667E
MSENTSVGRADAPRHRCRRTRPEAYRCACGRLRDRCVRAAVRALWSPTRRVAHGETVHPDAPRAPGPGGDHGGRPHRDAGAAHAG